MANGFQQTLSDPQNRIGIQQGVQDTSRADMINLASGTLETVAPVVSEVKDARALQRFEEGVTNILTSEMETLDPAISNFDSKVRALKQAEAQGRGGARVRTQALLQQAISERPEIADELTRRAQRILSGSAVVSRQDEMAEIAKSTMKEQVGFIYDITPDYGTDWYKYNQDGSLDVERTYEAGVELSRLEKERQKLYEVPAQSRLIAELSSNLMQDAGTQLGDLIKDMEQVIASGTDEQKLALRNNMGRIRVAKTSFMNKKRAELAAMPNLTPASRENILNSLEERIDASLSLADDMSEDFRLRKADLENTLGASAIELAPQIFQARQLLGDSATQSMMNWVAESQRTAITQELTSGLGTLLDTRTPRQKGTEDIDAIEKVLGGAVSYSTIPEKSQEAVRGAARRTIKDLSKRPIDLDEKGRSALLNSSTAVVDALDSQDLSQDDMLNGVNTFDANWRNSFNILLTDLNVSEQTKDLGSRVANKSFSSMRQFFNTPSVMNMKQYDLAINYDRDQGRYVLEDTATERSAAQQGLEAVSGMASLRIGGDVKKQSLKSYITKQLPKINNAARNVVHLKDYSQSFREANLNQVLDTLAALPQGLAETQRAFRSVGEVAQEAREGTLNSEAINLVWDPNTKQLMAR